MRNKKNLIAVAAVSVCVAMGLASYKSYQDYKKSSDNSLLMQEVEALTDADVSRSDWYLHNFTCKVTVQTKAQVTVLAKFFNTKAKVGGEVDLSNFTQYFNNIPYGGTGPCEKGTQVTCNDLWNQIIDLTKDN